VLQQEWAGMPVVSEELAMDGQPELVRSEVLDWAR